MIGISRQNNLSDFIRFAAAVSVLISHHCALSGFTEPFAPVFRDMLGGTAVAVFFTISGFLICDSLQRSNRWDIFFAARFLRIMPNLAFALVCGSAVMLVWFSNYKNLGLRSDGIKGHPMRTSLDRVVIHLQGVTERAEIACHWAGGVVTRHAVIHPVQRFEQLANFDQLPARAVALRTAGETAERIAAILNAEGFRPAKRSAFNAPMIRRLLQRHGHGTTRPIWAGKVPRADAEEMTLQEVADQLGAHWQTVYG